jgi:hypothetical protein
MSFLTKIYEGKKEFASQSTENKEPCKLRQFVCVIFAYFIFHATFFLQQALQSKLL